MIYFFYVSLIFFITVESAAGAYWRNAQITGECGVWRSGWLLSTDCLDSKCNVGEYILLKQIGHKIGTQMTRIGLQRDNVIFGQDFDTDRYWDAIERASLVPDLHVLPDGDLTEV